MAKLLFPMGIFGVSYTIKEAITQGFALQVILLIGLFLFVVITMLGVTKNE